MLIAVLAAALPLSSFPAPLFAQVLAAPAGAGTPSGGAAGAAWRPQAIEPNAVLNPLNPAGLSPGLWTPDFTAPTPPGAAGFSPVELPPSLIFPGLPEPALDATAGAAADAALAPTKNGAPARPIDALRSAGAELAKGADERQTLDALFVKLKLPSGAELQIRPAVTEAEKLTVMMHENSVPHDGIIAATGEDAPFEIWNKNTLVPVDVLGVGADGKIKSIARDLPPSPPETPWRRVGVYQAEGAYSIVLRAGRAKAEGLEVGQSVEISGLPPAAIRLQAKDLALRILEGGDSGASAGLKYFRENPGEFTTLDDAMDMVEAQIKAARAQSPENHRKYSQAKKRFYRAAFADREFTGLARGVLSLHEPLLWLKSASWTDWALATALSPVAIPLWATTKLMVLVHEFGHYAAARLVGFKVTRFRVLPAGGGYVFFNEKGAGWKVALVAVAGPGLQFLAGAAWAALTLFLPGGRRDLWGLFQSDNPAELIPLAFASFSAVYYMLYALPGGIYDWALAASSLKWTRLSAEISYRLQHGHYRNSSLFYYDLFYDLFIGERFGTRRSRVLK